MVSVCVHTFIREVGNFLIEWLFEDGKPTFQGDPVLNLQSNILTDGIYIGLLYRYECKVCL